MKKAVVITDLTRMQHGRVCVAGYDAGVQCLRPVLPSSGILEYMLGPSGRPLLYPGAEVEIDFGEPAPQPPHTEDVPFVPSSLRFLRRLPESAWRELLEATVYENVETIFGQPICEEPGHYVRDGRGPRSLGTIRPRRLLGVAYERQNGTSKYRLGFMDGSNTRYWLPITDLAWRYFLDHRYANGGEPEAIAHEMSTMLQSREVFLRVGLARGWDKHPGMCFLQINGIHTFPDYLDGRTFADFPPLDASGRVASHPLELFDLALLPDDEPAAWSSRLRTGLVSLAAEYDEAGAGLAVLEELFPEGQGSAGLTERDLWARLLLRRGSIEEALACAEQRRQTRDSYLPRLIVQEAQIAGGDLEAAAETARGVESTAGPRSGAPAVARSRLALARGQLDQAEQEFREALALRPDEPAALDGLAGVLAAAGDAAGAAGALYDAIEICSAEAKPALLRRLAELCPEERDAAETALREAIGMLAEHLRATLAQARAAPRRSAGSRVAAGSSPHATTSRRAPPGADLLAQVAAEVDEVPPEDLASILFEHFGHGSFRPGQAAVLRSVLSDGKDTLAIMPTGAGKSLCFQLPALVLPGVVLVVSPLVALMADQIAGLAEIPALAERACLINSSLPADELENRLRGLAAGAYSLVYVAPERLRHARLLHALQRAGVSLLVIDEAHCLCLWGHAFRPDYLAIGQLAEALDRPRILAVTATATPDMQAEIAHTLNRRLAVVNTGVLRENLYLEVCKAAAEQEKRARVLEFVRGTRGAGIVYTGSRDRCEQLAATLRRFGERAGHYHAGMPAAEREAAQRDFMSGRVRVLVATIAFGMGINKRDIRFIVHYQPSRSLEAYTQEVGRAGRDGQAAHCLLFATSADKGTLTRRAHEDHVDVETLRELYRRIRRAVGASAGAPIDLQSLIQPGGARNQDDVAARVGLSVLERAGFLTRGLDTPREVTMGLTEEPQAEPVRALAAALQLRVARQRTVSVTEVAAAMGIAIDAVEHSLAEWQEQGLIEFTAGRRGLLLTLADPAPADGSRRLDAIDRASDARARALARYIDATTCRNAVIARHFGVPTAPACGRCDSCAPQGRRAVQRAAAKPAPPRVTGLSPRRAILHLVDELPFAAGRTGLSRILAGAVSSPIEPERCRLFGALAGRTQVSITLEIESLLQEGLLAASTRGERPCIVLTDQGRHEIAE